MFGSYPNKKKKQSVIKNSVLHPTDGLSTGRNFSSEQIADLMLNRPELRLRDNAGNEELAYMLAGMPEDYHLQDLFQLITHDSIGKTIVTNDPFLGSYWPKNSISYPNDFLKLGLTPMGDAVGIVISQLTGNVLLVGRTKSAKTSLLTVLLSNKQLLKTTRIVLFAKKPEIRNISAKPDLYDLVLVLKLKELILCYFQPPDGVPEQAWITETTNIIGQSYARFSAQRLMEDKVNELMANHPKGVYPTLRQLARVIDEFRPRFGMREASYKESILWCLKSLLNRTGNIWDYSFSNFLEKLYTQPGLCIIEAEVLPQEDLTFIATYFMRWLYLKRVYTYKR